MGLDCSCHRSSAAPLLCACLRCVILRRRCAGRSGLGRCVRCSSQPARCCRAALSHTASLPVLWIRAGRACDIGCKPVQGTHSAPAGTNGVRPHPRRASCPPLVSHSHISSPARRHRRLPVRTCSYRGLRCAAHLRCGVHLLHQLSGIRTHHSCAASTVGAAVRPFASIARCAAALASVVLPVSVLSPPSHRERRIVSALRFSLRR